MCKREVDIEYNHAGALRSICLLVVIAVILLDYRANNNL
jgi:hypothetical protein